MIIHSSGGGGSEGGDEPSWVSRVVHEVYGLIAQDMRTTLDGFQGQLTGLASRVTNLEGDVSDLQDYRQTNDDNINVINTHLTHIDERLDKAGVPRLQEGNAPAVVPPTTGKVTTPPTAVAPTTGNVTFDGAVIFLWRLIVIALLLGGARFCGERVNGAGSTVLKVALAVLAVVLFLFGGYFLLVWLIRPLLVAFSH